MLPSQMDTFHSDGCVCSTEEKNKHIEHITQESEQMRRLWLQVCRIIANFLQKLISFNCLHDREAVIQKNTPPYYYLFVWIVSYCCCPLLECSWLISQKMSFKLSHSAETELFTPLRATISDFFEQISLQ